MEKFVGEYQLVKEENFIEHLRAIGITRDIPTELPKEPLGIAVDGKKISIIHPKLTSTVILNEEVEEPRPFGNEKNIAKLEGENFIVYSTRSNGTKSKKIYSITGSELTIKYVDDKPGIPEAKRIFKKL